MHGESNALKEYNIAIDVFGRGPDFDQTSDAIVRVEVHRLRKKLEKFYAGEGAGEPLKIVIEPGRYAPEFVTTHSTFSIEQAPAQPALEAPLARLPLPGPTPRPLRLAAAYRFGPALVIFAGLCIVAGALMWFRRARPAQARTTAKPASIALPAQSSELRILCGATQPILRDREGNRWDADAYFTGGTPTSSPVSALYRTRNYRLFSTARVGEFSYRIPLRPGAYELHLYFADTSFRPGPAMDGGENRRVFEIEMNGLPLLKQFDIIADSGPDTADVRVFKDIHPAPDGFLELAFRARISEPLLNAVEVLPGESHRIRPLRIVAQERSYIDTAGHTWLPDDYFLFGRLYPKTGNVTGTPDAELYGWERYGHFSYAIPVAPGSYALTLHFGETYFGPQNPGGGGKGSRVFDVLCNGVPLLKDFDLLKEAPVHTAISRTFRDLHPNAQGKLLLSFNPSANYATLSALEVLDESQ